MDKLKSHWRERQMCTLHISIFIYSFIVFIVSFCFVRSPSFVIVELFHSRSPSHSVATFMLHQGIHTVQHSCVIDVATNKYRKRNTFIVCWNVCTPLKSSFVHIFLFFFLSCLITHINILYLYIDIYLYLYFFLLFFVSLSQANKRTPSIRVFFFHRCVISFKL